MTTVTNKQIWLIAYPILVSVVMEHLINVTDTIFLGHYGEVELGASALAGVYYTALFMIAFGFSIGAQIIMARRNGEKHFLRIGSVLVQGIFFMLGLAGLMFWISRTWTPDILRLIISSDQVYDATMDYLDWRIYGFFFAFIAIMFRAFFVGITQTKILTINSLVMVGSNIVLNYALIFGHWGCPRLGIAGAAIASSVAELISLVFFIVYTKLKVDWEKYGFKYAFEWKPKLMLGMLSLSSWTMVQSFLSVSTWFIFFLAIEHLGERSLALANIARSVSSLLFMMISAFCSTASTLASNQIGAGRPDLVISTCKKSIKLCYLLISPLIVLTLIFPHAILSFYTDNIELINTGSTLMRIMAISIWIITPAVILFNVISGTGNTKKAFLLELVCLAIYMLSVYVIIFWMRADVSYSWFTEYIYGITLLWLSYHYLKKGTWRHKRI
ncbi:MAG: MATE family efflux transporter [Akkermansia sp.]